MTPLYRLELERMLVDRLAVHRQAEVHGDTGSDWHIDGAVDWIGG
jgi:hypothetical protein